MTNNIDDSNGRIGLSERDRCASYSDDEIISSDIVATSFREDSSPERSILEDSVGESHTTLCSDIERNRRVISDTEDRIIRECNRDGTSRTGFDDVSFEDPSSTREYLEGSVCMVGRDRS